MITRMKQCTWDRYRALCRSNLSMLRTMQYEALASMTLHGRALDAGGGAKAGYRQLLRGAATLDSINIDSSMEPTHVGDLNQPLPFDSETFDSIVSLNTLEHVRHDERALTELLRVLKPGGVLNIMVPFLYRVHASPSDYHRHPAPWWEQFFSEHGIDSKNVVVEPLGWGRWGSLFGIGEPMRLRKLLRPLVLLPAMIAEGIAPARWPHSGDYALGYFIRVTKE